MSDLDRLLEEIRRLSTRLDALGPDAPERAGLEQRRTELRHAAADLGRDSPAALPAPWLEQEREHLQRRLRDLERLKITEKRRRFHITDPNAFSAPINAALEAATATEREQIRRRLAEIARLLGES